MNLRERLLWIWHDNVWGSVIAAAIIAIAVYIFRALSLIPFFVSILLYAIVVLFVIILWVASQRKPKMLIFVSSGGTCRDPMAKIILSKVLEKRKLNHPIDIRSVGFGPLSYKKASFAARNVIKNMYNEDLLANHRAEILTLRLVKQADLILVMDKHLQSLVGKNFPNNKTYLLKEFFGLSGDVIDPYLDSPDRRDEETLSKYRRSAEELKDILTNNVDRLVEVLDA